MGVEKKPASKTLDEFYEEANFKYQERLARLDSVPDEIYRTSSRLSALRQNTKLQPPLEAGSWGKKEAVTFREGRTKKVPPPPPPPPPPKESTVEPIINLSRFNQIKGKLLSIRRSAKAQKVAPSSTRSSGRLKTIVESENERNRNVKAGKRGDNEEGSK